VSSTLWEKGPAQIKSPTQNTDQHGSDQHKSTHRGLARKDESTGEALTVAERVGVADGGLDAHLHGHGDGDGVLRVSECVAEC
jgi:hypothetical protein